MALFAAPTTPKVVNRFCSNLFVMLFVGVSLSVHVGKLMAQQSELPLPSIVYAAPTLLVSDSTAFMSESLASIEQHLTANQIAHLAGQNSNAARLVRLDAQARKSSSSFLNIDQKSEKLLGQFESAAAFRLRQLAVSNALKLHYAMAASNQAKAVFDETEALIQVQRETQSQLIEKGIPIPDDLLIQRLLTGLNDKRLENESKFRQLRSQLSLLIGPQYACPHSPTENSDIVPSDSDVCDRIEQAMQCRCDLLTMIQLRSSIQAETLDAWNSIGALTSNAPAIAKPKSTLPKILRTHIYRSEIECAVQARLAWLDSLIAERKKLIALEVETAFEKKKTAALRWVLACQQVEEWNQRIEQLVALSEVQGNLAEQFTAKLNRQQAIGQRIERWLEWHQANCELTLALGCDQDTL